MFPFPAPARERVTVGREPFPPPIVDAESGHAITLLKELEKASDFVFEIRILTHSRAKAELKNGRADLIGHTRTGWKPGNFTVTPRN